MSGRSILKIVVLSLLVVLGFGDIVYAYVDPGTGSYVFQLLIAGLLGAAFAMKAFWKNIQAFISTKFLRKSNLSEDDEQ